MPSDNEKSANSGGSGTGLVETPTDEDFVALLEEGLVASDGSHLGSISAHCLDPESIGDPPEDGFLDQGHQEGVGGGGVIWLMKRLILGWSLGVTNKSQEMVILVRLGGRQCPQRQIHHPPDIQQPTGCFYVI